MHMLQHMHTLTHVASVRYSVLLAACSLNLDTSPVRQQSPLDGHFAYVMEQLRLEPQQQLLLAAGHELYREKLECLVPHMQQLRQQLSQLLDPAAHGTAAGNAGGGGKSSTSMCMNPTPTAQCIHAPVEAAAAAAAAFSTKPCAATLRVSSGATMNDSNSLLWQQWGCRGTAELDYQQHPQALEATAHQLHRAMLQAQQLARVQAYMLFNTLTNEQLGKLAVSSWPFLPDPFVVLDCIVQLGSADAQDEAEDQGVGKDMADFGWASGVSKAGKGGWRTNRSGTRGQAGTSGAVSTAAVGQ